MSKHKWLNKLNKLVLENPDAQIIHMVSEEVNNGDYSYMSFDNISVRLTRYVIYNDGYMIDDDEECLLDEISNDLCDDNKHLSDDEFEKLVKSEYDKFIEGNPWTKAIYITVG